ncbi:MAG: glycerol-3-phosphate acyltransferase [Oscillospiraceae bacterium]|nr:glycerol-3-phosphate acyltransferase [Oscillospiraceae bacterium]MBQ4642441.1 glycerol-3-phosphate acyltransferase [Oscillospiraceae bacterium]
MAMAAVLTLLTGYLLGNLNGAVSMSVLLGKDDIRNHGSGNAGLTNFMRRFGPSSGLLVVGIDMIKAILACLVGKYLLASHGLGDEGLMLGAVAVTLGHDFPALLGFKGGKGVLCGAAIALTADWRCGLLVIAIFALSLWLTRWVSVSSIFSSLAFSISFGLLHRENPFVAVAGVLLGLWIVFMHRSNIKRLVNGTEKKATFSQFRKKNKS